MKACGFAGCGCEFEPRQPLQNQRTPMQFGVFLYPQHTHFLHLHKIRGRGVDASLSLVSRSGNQKSTDVFGAFVLLKPPAAVNSLPVYRFTMIVQ